MPELADDLAQWVLNRLHISSVPPINVELLADRMGITAIRSAAMIEDGRLEQDGRSATIFLREGLPEARRRFTIAHELGHRILLHPGAPAQRYRTRLAGDAEERLCDDIAAAILLPRPWVSTTFRTERHCLATIRRLSGTTNTSMSASLVRLAEVLGWPESLLRFRFVDLRWRLDAPAAVPFQVHGQLRTTPETSEALDAVGKRTRRDTEAIVPLRIAGRNWRVRAEVSVARTVAVALLNLRPEPGLAEPD